MIDLKEDLEHLPHKEYFGDNGGLSYMSDTSNWVCVHLTKYKPKTNSDGNLCIQTTAAATNYKYPRATVHVTLNQRVSNHGYGNWNGASIVILAPYNDVVAKNGNPQEVAAEDTYFIPDPDTGLVLPESAHIIQPGDTGGELFVLDEHGATYKTDKYTDEEIEKILALNGWDKDTYEKYLKGDVPDYEVDRILGYDDKLRKVYDKAKDKPAFIRGIMEEDRFTILNKLLRDYVTQKVMDKMGYHYVHAHEDDVSGKIAEVARAAGIRGNSGNKGHSCSVEHEMDRIGQNFMGLVEAVKSKNVDDICQCMESQMNPLNNQIVLSLISDSPMPNFYRAFEKAAIHEGEENIKNYNPRLCTVLRRFIKRTTNEFMQAMKELKKNPQDYNALIKRLRNYAETTEIRPEKLWMERTRRSFDYIEHSKERIAELRERIAERPEKYLENEKKYYEDDIVTERLKIEDNYRDANPHLARLRAIERKKVQSGEDPKKARKERRKEVIAYYNSLNQKEI